MTHTFWLGRDNEQALELHEDGANLDLARYDAITKIALTLRPIRGGSDIALDSDQNVGLLTWGTAGPGRKVKIEGAVLDDAGVPAGSYGARLVVYSADQQDGVVWIDFPDYAFEVRA